MACWVSMETLSAFPSAPAHFPVQPPSVGTSQPQVQSPLLLRVSANLLRIIHPLGLGGLSLSLLTKPFIKIWYVSLFILTWTCFLDLFQPFWDSHLRPPGNPKKSNAQCFPVSVHHQPSRWRPVAVSKADTQLFLAFNRLSELTYPLTLLESCWKL